MGFGHFLKDLLFFIVGDGRRTPPAFHRETGSVLTLMEGRLPPIESPASLPAAPGFSWPGNPLARIAQDT